MPSAKKYILAFFVAVFLAHVLFIDDSPPTAASDPAHGCPQSDSEEQDIGISLLQEGVQVFARGDVTRVNGEEGAAPPLEAAARCAANRAKESETAAPELDQAAFLQRFAKPYRLRTVCIAIIGFGLLTLDSSSAVLLAF
eukprot:CAMPEP_0204608504 /NCGR_PEP_ID=MMETSP0661-20131031/60354_1 /ASSEMBLY_ACC=CAM_ASM_000606 /TAXON_ID=109239 /ORGANISM="Alexandrium margalefi, Strain AMGDE01CS-322" /LENGTH=139 /DNA_ID=CAMNT_0051620031 /DNA_START=98 /DNA_END=517 /DNA_ORIENTATION=-